MKYTSPFGDTCGIIIAISDRFADLKATGEWIPSNDCEKPCLQGKKSGASLEVDGIKITNPKIILYELSKRSEKLGGKTIEEKKAVAELLHAFSQDFIAPAMLVFGAASGWRNNSPAQVNQAKQDIMGLLSKMNEKLGSNFLTGEQLLLPDIAFGVILSMLFQVSLGQEKRDKLPKLMAWFDRVTTNSAFLAILGKPKLVKQDYQLPRYKIHTLRGNYRSNQIYIVATMLGVGIDFCYMERSEIKGNDNFNRNPLGKIPTLEVPQGNLYETMTILRFLARGTPLYDLDGCRTAKIDQWLDWFNQELQPALRQTLRHEWGYDKTAQDPKEFFEGVKKHLDVMDKQLKDSPYLVGDSVSIADIALAGVIVWLFGWCLTNPQKFQFQNVVKWFKKISAIPEFKAVYGHMGSREAPKKGEPKEKVDKQEKQETKKGGKKQDAETAHKEEKADKKKGKKSDDEGADEEDEAITKEKKVKNPLDLLPPTNFDLYSFKTMIVNAKDKTESFKFLWDNFDPEGFSLWIARYKKDPDECKVRFRSSNLYNGFLQKLDPWRKYTIGVHGMYGEPTDHEIRGAWLWRGAELHPQLVDHADLECYTWQKLDPKNPEDQKLLEEYWLTGNGEGKAETLAPLDV